MMANDVDPVMPVLARVISQAGRRRFIAALVPLLFGIGGIWIWFTGFMKADVGHDGSLFTLAGVIGAGMALYGGFNTASGLRDMLRPNEHVIYRGLAGGKLRSLVRDNGSIPSIAFDFVDLYKDFPAPRRDVDELASVLRQRYPHIPFKEVVVTVRRI